MKIIFLEDYQGRETAGQLHKRGEVIEIHHPAAMELLKYGIAQEYEEVKETPKKKKGKEVLDDTDA